MGSSWRVIRAARIFAICNRNPPIKMPSIRCSQSLIRDGIGIATKGVSDALTACIFV